MRHYRKTYRFTVSLSGCRWHSVALDLKDLKVATVHSIALDLKDLKLATVHAIPSYLQKTSVFFTCRIAAYKNLYQQLFPDKINQPQSDNLRSVTDNTTTASIKKKKTLSIYAHAFVSHLFFLCKQTIMVSSTASPDEEQDHNKQLTCSISVKLG